MKSNDNHINSPMRRVDIDLNEVAQPMTQIVTQEFYDLMECHDPGTIYAIADSTDGRVYMGDNLLPIIDPKKPKYFMAVNEDGTYTVYTALWDEYGRAWMIANSTYDDPQKAINMMIQYKNIGGTDELNLKVYTALGAYIVKENGLNETIINIIALMGWRDHPYLQYLIERAISYGVEAADRELPVLMKTDLRKEPGFPSLVKLYADIYDVFVLYDFFKGAKYRGVEADQLDLAEPVQRIVACSGLS